MNIGPVAVCPDAEAPIALRGSVAISRGRLWSEVGAVAASLPERPYVFNLCEDRYLFLLTLLAALQRRQTCLLPPSGQAGVLREILDQYPDAYVASDRDDLAVPSLRVQIVAPESGNLTARPDFEPGQAAVIAFTSGSTGNPTPVTHALETFLRSAAMALESLELRDKRLLLVSTTPPQHMFGLETSIFWPLCSRLVLHPGRPFFPEDIRRTVAEAPLPVLLVSTPTHLRALASANGAWSNLAGIVSSTAPLSAELAQELERMTGVEVREIFGSTETLSFASRRAALDEAWVPYKGAVLESERGGKACLHSEHLPAQSDLPDILEIQQDGRFRVLGRGTDMVKIAGKRLSLSELNRRLTEIPGIVDGLCYVHSNGAGEPRVHAVVVGELAPDVIQNALRPVLDPVFLPRQIHYVTALPRQHTGKIRKADLDDLLARLEQRAPAKNRAPP